MTCVNCCSCEARGCHLGVFSHSFWGNPTRVHMRFHQHHPGCPVGGGGPSVPGSRRAVIDGGVIFILTQNNLCYTHQFKYLKTCHFNRFAVKLADSSDYIQYSHQSRKVQFPTLRRGHSVIILHVDVIHLKCACSHSILVWTNFCAAVCTTDKRRLRTAH